MTRRFTSAVAEPYPRGLEFGRAHAAQITTTVADYLRLFELKNTLGIANLPAEVDRLGAAALDRIQAWAPELADEIRGIAIGAGLAVERIAAINARTEILASLRGLGVRMLHCGHRRHGNSGRDAELGLVRRDG